MDESLLLEEGHDICTICIDLIQKESIYFRCLNCKHTIHIDCLFNWFKNKKKIICPICKKNINTLNKNIVNVESDYFTKNKILANNFINTLRSLIKINNDFGLELDLDLDLDNNYIEKINNVNIFYNILIQIREFVYNVINWCCSPVEGSIDCYETCKVLIYCFVLLCLITFIAYLHCILFDHSESCYNHYNNKTI